MISSSNFFEKSLFQIEDSRMNWSNDEHAPARPSPYVHKNRLLSTLLGDKQRDKKQSEVISYLPQVETVAVPEKNSKPQQSPQNLRSVIPRLKIALPSILTRYNNNNLHPKNLPNNYLSTIDEASKSFRKERTYSILRKSRSKRLSDVTTTRRFADSVAISGRQVLMMKPGRPKRRQDGKELGSLSMVCPSLQIQGHNRSIFLKK